MGHEELKEIGINAYGHRHKLIKGVERLLGGQQGKLWSSSELYAAVVEISVGLAAGRGRSDPRVPVPCRAAPPASHTHRVAVPLPLVAVAGSDSFSLAPHTLYLNISGFCTSVLFYCCHQFQVTTILLQKCHNRLSAYLRPSPLPLFQCLPCTVTRDSFQHDCGIISFHCSEPFNRTLLHLG